LAAAVKPIISVGTLIRNAIITVGNP